MVRKKGSSKSKKKTGGGPKRARSLTPEEIHGKLNAWLVRKKQPFCLREACQQLGPSANAADVAYALGIRFDVVTVPDENGEDCYLSRHKLFQKAQFRVKLTPLERQQRVMIPGHRFVPFVTRECFPAAVAVLDHRGQALPTKRIRTTYRELLIFLTFFSEMERFDYLERDGVALDADFHPEEPIEVTAYDLSSLSATDGSLLFEVESWGDGRVRMIREQQALLPLDFAGTSDWLDRLQAGLNATFELLGPANSVDDQLAHAMVLGGITLTAAPPLHIGGFLASQEEIRLVHSSPSHTCLWDEEIEDLADFGPGRASLGAPDELSRTLTELSVALDRNEVEGLMRHAANYREPLRGVLDRVLAGRSRNSAAAKRAEKLMTELWEYVEETDEITRDLTKASLRSVAVELTMAQVDFLRGLDLRGVDPQQLPVEQTMEFASLSQLLNAILQLTNRADAIDAGNARELLAGLDQARSRFDDAMEAIESAVSEGESESIVVMPPDMFQLKLVLLDSEPEVWRRLMVPTAITLDELHLVVQIAMGWEDDHLHEFVIKKQRFAGVPAHCEYGVDPGDGAFSADGVVLSELISRARSKFRYLYDYGDDWTHELQVEKIHKDVEDMGIRCLDGANACPPEDSGGVYGYRYKLEAYADPKSRDYPDAYEWLGEDFDATKFDLDAVNRSLARVTAAWYGG